MESSMQDAQGEPGGLSNLRKGAWPAGFSFPICHLAAIAVSWAPKGSHSAEWGPHTTVTHSAEGTCSNRFKSASASHLL